MGSRGNASVLRHRETGPGHPPRTRPDASAPGNGHGGPRRTRPDASAPGNGQGGLSRSPEGTVVAPGGADGLRPARPAGSGDRGWRDRYGSPGRPPTRVSARGKRPTRRAVPPQGAAVADLPGTRASARGKERRAAAEVTRPRGRRITRERHRRTGRTWKQVSLRRGRWKGEAGSSPRGAVARNHPSSGLRPGRRMGSGSSGSRGWPASRTRVGGRASARTSTRARRAGRWKERLPRRSRCTCFGTGGGAGGAARGRGAGERNGPGGRVAPRCGQAPETGSSSPDGAAAGGPLPNVGFGRQQGEASGGRGGRTGLFGTNVARERASVRWRGAGGLAGRLAGRRRHEPTAHGLRPGGRRDEQQSMS
jgi:hypothetical protein